MPMMKRCTCGSGKLRYELYDARGIFCSFICEDCEQKCKSRFRADIFTNPNYWHDEPIDDD